MMDWKSVAKTLSRVAEDSACSRANQLKSYERQAQREGKMLNEHFYEEKAKAEETYNRLKEKREMNEMLERRERMFREE